jgi:hypothetical protein
MSRNLGRYERHAMTLFDLGAVGTTRQIASAMLGREPTRVELVSISRAIRSLRRWGLVDGEEARGGLYRRAEPR